MNAKREDPAKEQLGDRPSTASAPLHANDPVRVRLDLIFRRFKDAPQDDFFRAQVIAYRTQAPS